MSTLSDALGITESRDLSFPQVITLAHQLLEGPLPAVDHGVAQAVAHVTASMDQLIEMAEESIYRMKADRDAWLQKTGNATRDWAVCEIGKSTPRQIKLPQGVLQLRKNPLRLVVGKDADFPPARRRRLITDWLVGDEFEDALCSLRESGCGFKVEDTISKSAAQDHFKTTGQVPSGCDVVGGDDSLYLAYGDGKRIKLAGSAPATPEKGDFDE